MLYDKNIILNMVKVHEISYEPWNITKNKTGIIDKDNILKYGNELFNFNNDRSCVGNGRLFYFNDDRQLQLLNSQREIFHDEKYVLHSFLFNTLEKY